MAVDEIERYTGFKALVLVGGPEPLKGGKITTHVYVELILTWGSWEMGKVRVKDQVIGTRDREVWTDTLTQLVGRRGSEVGWLRVRHIEGVESETTSGSQSRPRKRANRVEDEMDATESSTLGETPTTAGHAG